MRPSPLYCLVLSTRSQEIFTKTFFYSGDTFLLPNKTFMMMGGIRAYDLQSVTFQIGTSRCIIHDNNRILKRKRTIFFTIECYPIFYKENVLYIYR